MAEATTQGEIDPSADIFAPVNDPDLGQGVKAKKCTKSKREKPQEEESSPLGPTVVEKEIAIAAEIHARELDDIQAARVANRNGGSHVGHAEEPKAGSLMHDDNLINETDTASGMATHTLTRETSHVETEKKKPAKTPKKKGKKTPSTVSAAEFTKTLASGSTLDMLSDEQVARLSEEQFNQILEHEQEKQE